MTNKMIVIGFALAGWTLCGCDPGPEVLGQSSAALDSDAGVVDGGSGPAQSPGPVQQPAFCQAVGGACANGKTQLCPLWEDYCRHCGGANLCSDQTDCAALHASCEANHDPLSCGNWEKQCRDCSKPCAQGDLCTVTAELCQAGRADACELHARECQ